jgi:hypothetical protein
MQSKTVSENAVLSTQDVKTMAAAAGPCISIYLPVAPTGVDRREQTVRLKKAVERVQLLLREREVEDSLQRTLLEPIHTLVEGGGYGHAKVLAIFRSPDLFRHYSLLWQLDEMVAVADHFQIGPLLPLLYKHKAFYILTLSQKNIRLLRCTDVSSEEVTLPDSIPHTLEEFMATDQPDHVLDNRSTGGPSTGSMKGVMFGTGTDREKKDEYMQHFYKQIDRGLSDLLRDDPAPVVLAGVDYELALYHNVTKYPNLVDDGVQGAPGGLKGGELHRRAVELVQSQNRLEVEDLLAQYDKLGGTDRTSTDAANILRAAREGRVAHLFLAEGMDTAERYNMAAMQTILNSGQVHFAPLERMPGAETMAALFRY